jgi:hypothetical protein
MEPTIRPKTLRKTPLATNTTTKKKGKTWPKPPWCSHFLSGSGKGSPLTTAII